MDTKDKKQFAELVEQERVINELLAVKKVQRDDLSRRKIALEEELKNLGVTKLEDIDKIVEERTQKIEKVIQEATDTGNALIAELKQLHLLEV